MFAQLGNTIFQGLFSYSDFKRENETNYVEISLMNGKSDLQKTGLKLDTLSLHMKLHINFCDPAERYDTLELHRVNGDILPFINGYGTLMGNFVIEKTVQNMVQTDRQGRAIYTELELTLKEYVSPDRIVSRAKAAREAAIALTDRKDLTLLGSVTTIQPSISASADIFKSVSNVSLAGAAAKEAVIIPNPTTTDMQRGLKSLYALQRGLAEINTKITQYGDAVNTAQSFRNNIEAARNAAQALTTAVLNGDVANYKAGAQALAQVLGSLTLNGLPLQKDLIIRK